MINLKGHKSLQILFNSVQVKGQNSKDSVSDFKKKFSKPASAHMNAVIMVKHVHEHRNMSTHFSKRLILHVYCFGSHAG